MYIYLLGEKKHEPFLGEGGEDPPQFIFSIPGKKYWFQ